MCLSGSSLDTLKSKVACQHLSRSKIIKEHGKSDDKKCEKLWIIVKLILHIKCVLNYAKVYVKHNIYHKKSKYMIFHVLSLLITHRSLQPYGSELHPVEKTLDMFGTMQLQSQKPRKVAYPPGEVRSKRICV